ncbi:acyl-ACP desaturase [Telmatospirillum siberiense]|uniref:Rubrerythrin family protein n=1 Tax=Telmatospirillum siberiense TaxID=382514 RepID=A0A2N3PY70_9PROT|nr:ferritin-like domain-containing protein [Telmatospirillum siberiense]PKU25356.1 rubrerythrin family protein [Telmatospirillum siberiense]
MPRWTQDDIPWDDFDPARLQPDHLKLVKAASLTEYNAARYTQYLKNVFAGDDDFAAIIAGWQAEEEQHGAILGRYAELADPAYDFSATFERFRDGYVIPVDVSQSIRGSRVGELLARCIVETGTSSFYMALSEASDEPVLKAIAKHIAADELRHYRMFLDGMRKHQPIERVSLPGRLRVVLGRIRESDDDELAFAYHCGNEPGEDYDRLRSNTAYGALAYRIYRFPHAQRAVGMVFKATGLNPQGWLARQTARWAWRKMQARVLRAA